MNELTNTDLRMIAMTRQELKESMAIMANVDCYNELKNKLEEVQDILNRLETSADIETDVSRMCAILNQVRTGVSAITGAFLESQISVRH